MSGPCKLNYGILLLAVLFSCSESRYLSKYLTPHILSQDSFVDISKCKGEYDMAVYAKFNQICMDCYNLYDREPFVFRSCR